jgi:hypothetical protein
LLVRFDAVTATFPPKSVGLRCACCTGGDCAPLPPGAKALVDAGGYPLLPRLWARELGGRTPKNQADLRERVRLAAIQLIYEEELQVSAGFVGGRQQQARGAGWGSVAGRSHTGSMVDRRQEEEGAPCMNGLR